MQKQQQHRKELATTGKGAERGSMGSRVSTAAGYTGGRNPVGFPKALQQWREAVLLLQGSVPLPWECRWGP